MTAPAALFAAVLVAASVWGWWRRPSPTGRHRVPAPFAPTSEPGTGSASAPEGGTGRSAAGPREAVPCLDVASAAELLALVLGSGVSVTEAVDTVAGTVGGLLGRHLMVVVAAQRWGLGDAEAWARLPDAWQPVARALQVAGEAGVAPAEMLRAAAEDMRLAERHRLELATARLGVRVVLPLGLAFLPSFALTTVVPVILALGAQVVSR